MTDTEILYRLALVVGLGMLVGMQRERVDDPLAGFRTFPLIALAGAIAGLLGSRLGLAWLLPAGLLAVTAAIIGGSVMLARDSEEPRGMTTEMAALVMFLVGAQAMDGSLLIAASVSGAVAVMLHFKAGLHALVDRLTETDVRAVMQFVLISLIILPLLPDRSYGPFEAFNPFETWLMVVLIVGLNLGGYVAFRLIGRRGGSLLSGALGGMVSSTAATVSLSRQSGQQMTHGLAAIAIMLASTVVLGRVIVELGVVAPGLLKQAVLPLVVLGLIHLAICVAAYFRFSGHHAPEVPDITNPAQLKPAIVFGGLYALVRFLVAAGNAWLGDSGLYLVAAVAGLTDVDAITLSTAQMVGTGQVAADTAWRIILVAILSNLVFKGGITLTMGGTSLFRPIAVMFGAVIVFGLIIVVFWP